MTASLCPTCRKAPPAAAYAPFCSRRCADVDLQRWLVGAYAVKGAEEDEEAASEAGRPEVDPL